MTFGIHFVGRGNSWFTGVNADRRACFHGQAQANRFESEAEAIEAMTEIPECIRKWFRVEEMSSEQLENARLDTYLRLEQETVEIVRAPVFRQDRYETWVKARDALWRVLTAAQRAALCARRDPYTRGDR